MNLVIFTSFPAKTFKFSHIQTQENAQQLQEPLDQCQKCLYKRQQSPKPATKVNSYNDYAFPNKYHNCKDTPAEGQKEEQDIEPEVGQV